MLYIVGAVYNEYMNIDDIAPEFRDKIQTQQYDKPEIEGVKIFHLQKFVTEDGSFSELLRFSQNGTLEILPEFHIAQINRSIMLPNTVKAWHIHFNQDEVWNVSARTHLLLGLWDLREHSSTKGKAMRIPMSSEKLVYIPRGVAHGAANHMTHATEIFYFVNNTYNKDTPDEQRLPWDSNGKEFWDIKRE